MKKAFLALVMLAFLASCTAFDQEETLGYQVFTFDNVDPSYIAGPTSYGENLYSAFGANQFTSYQCPETGLQFGINMAPSYDWQTYEYLGDTYEFWNGGICISNWNDKETAGYLNQCSVHYRHFDTGLGGYGGSANFGVVYGSGSAVLSLAGEDTQRVFDHLYINNTTYAYLSMRNGDDFAYSHNFARQDWFKVTLTGVDAQGTETGAVDVYLSDFRTSDAPGIMTWWTKVDLTSLGAVHQVVFSFSGSDSGEWGLNTPATCCIDNVAIRNLSE